MLFKSAIKKMKLSVYSQTFFILFSIISFLNIFIYWGKISFIYLILFMINSAFCYLITRNVRKNNEYLNNEFLPEKEVYEKLFDKYTRKLFNWIMIAFLELSSLLLTSLSLNINSKTAEIFSTINGNLVFLEVLFFFLIKNALLLRWIIKNFKYDKAPLLKNELKKIMIFSSIYWVLGIGVFYLFESVFVINIISFLRAVYIIAIIVTNLSCLKKVTYENRQFYKPVVAIVCILVLLVGGYTYLSRDVWLTQPYINSVPNLCENSNSIQYNEKSGVYTITKCAGDFKILQLTDIHLGGSALSYDKDLKAMKAVYQLIDKTRPDLVIVTGDLVFPVGYASFSFNNTAPVQQFAAFMRNLGIPWAFTYGNHDTESYALATNTELNDLYKSLSWKTSKTLLYSYVQPDIMGRNNQLIELRNEDGSLNQAVFLIDSNAYTGDGMNKYDYIHDDQVDWYEEQILRLSEEEGHTVSSMVFFHIPLQEYKEAYELYEKGSNQVTYFFGSNDEKMMDKVCCSEYPSKMFDTALKLQSTSHFFCGHDHYNNISLEYKGIRLTYGMSIDYLAMPGIARDTKQRGGTLITIHNDSTSELEQIPLSD